MVSQWIFRANQTRSKLLARFYNAILRIFYSCEVINSGVLVGAGNISETTRFAHQARNCTLLTSGIEAGVVIYQNVTLGSNAKYNTVSERWENIGVPYIEKNAMICDGAKVLGPVTIGAGSIVAAGAIVTRDVPGNHICYGVNQLKAKDEKYDYLISSRSNSDALFVEYIKQKLKQNAGS